MNQKIQQLEQREIDQMLLDSRMIDRIKSIVPGVPREDLESLTSEEIYEVYSFYTKHRGAE